MSHVTRLHEISEQGNSVKAEWGQDGGRRMAPGRHVASFENKSILELGSGDEWTTWAIVDFGRGFRGIWLHSNKKENMTSYAWSLGRLAQMGNQDTHNVYTCIHMHVMSTSRKLLPICEISYLCTQYIHAYSLLVYTSNWCPYCKDGKTEAHRSV